MVPAAIRQRVQKMVEKCIAKAEAHFKRKYRIPEVKYNLTGRCGGQAIGDRTIRVHPVFLMENLEHYIESTVPHEVAHCIDTANGDNQRRAWQRKREVHGPSWRHIMHVLGVQDADRCHTYSMENVKIKGASNRVEYQCGGCKQQFMQTQQMHKKLQAGHERWCRKCGRGRGQLLWVRDGVVQPSRVPSRPITGSSHIYRTQPPMTNYAGFLRQLTAVLQTPSAQLPDLKPLVPHVVKDSGKTSAELAKAIYRPGIARSEFIRLCVQRGMKATTAGTYYYNMRKS